MGQRAAAPAVLEDRAAMRGSWIIIGSLWALACSAPSYVKTAYYGDLPTLKKQITAAAGAGSVDQSGVKELARAIARREVRSAHGKDVSRRIEEARECARAVEPELEEWADKSSDEAGEALLVLVDAGLRDAESLVERHSHAESGAFRAVAARGTGSEEQAQLRRAYFSDPDERVRHAAFHAAMEAMDPRDLPLLLEASRLDPSYENRGLAARAAGLIGGSRVVLGLLDVWPSAEPDVQLEIVKAWATPATFQTGGSRELLRVAERSDSLASIAAAGELARTGGPGAAEGRGVLARAIADGTSEERILAIQLAPLSDSAAIDALERAGKSDDAPVRVVALARLLEVPSKKATALAQLREIAQREDAAARQSRAALAVAGDQHAAPLLEKQLSDPDSFRRRQAAVGLYRLGHAAQMAQALADSDPTVRMSVACAVLSGRLDRT